MKNTLTWIAGAILATMIAGPIGLIVVALFYIGVQVKNKK